MSDNVQKAIKVIDDLLKAGIGDTERLESIKEKLEKKITITAEDVEYIQEQREQLGKIKPKSEPEPEEPIEDTPKKTLSDKPPKVKDSKKSMSKKKIIVVGVLCFFALVILSVSSYAYFTVAPILENVQTEEEFNSIPGEIDKQFGAITTPCLNLYNKIQVMENTNENVDEKTRLLRDYVDLRCNDTADQWNPEVIAENERKEAERLAQKLDEETCIDLASKRDELRRAYDEQTDKIKILQEKYYADQTQTELKEEFERLADEPHFVSGAIELGGVTTQLHVSCVDFYEDQCYKELYFSCNELP